MTAYCQLGRPPERVRTPWAMSPAAPRRRSSVPRRDSDAIVVLARDDEELASWPLWWLGRPTLEAVDELARLQAAQGWISG